MSGGSHDSFYCKEIECFEQNNLDRIIEELVENKAEDIAKELHEIQANLCSLSKRKDSLFSVLYKFERYISGDSCISGFYDEHKKWQNSKNS